MDTSDVLTPELSIEHASGRRSTHVARWLAWGLWAMSLGQVLAGLFLATLNNLTIARLFAEYVASATMAALAFATVGAIISTRRPSHIVGWLMCAAGVVAGLGAWTGQYARYTFVSRPGALPFGDLIAWLYICWSFAPFVALTAIFLPLLFPNGQLPTPRWRPVAWLSVGATLLFTAVLAFAPGPVDASLPEVENPYALAGIEAPLAVIGPLALGLLLLCMLSAVVAVALRLWRARDAERQQLKWFAYATALLLLAMIGPGLLDPTGFNDPAHGDTLLSGVLLTAGLTFVPIAVGIAVLRYRLYDIDLIINRTLVYGALTACVIGVYVFVVNYLGTLFRGAGAADTRSWLSFQLVATGIVAVLFQPLRAWLQRGVNRLLYGDRDEPYAVLSRLGRRLEAALVPEAVLQTVVATVRDALKLPYAAVALKRDDGFVLAVAEGAPAGALLRLPLSYQGELVGQLLVSPRAPDEAWSAAERGLLGDLAHHAGVAVHGVQVMMELQRARERLVLAREEERRRLRGDLHDDLAPALAALALTAATIGELIPNNPQAAATAVVKLQNAIRTTVGDVRRLVYDLRPPTLDELGLVEAIREQAARYSNAPGSSGGTGPLRVTLELPEPLPPLPAAVEVAVYRIVQEALMNVSRHARADTCVIRLACTNGRAIEVEIRDNGAGLAGELRRGVGMRSMRERASELGGVCEITNAAPNGVRVAAWFPIGTDNELEIDAYGSAAHSDRR